MKRRLKRTQGDLFLNSNCIDLIYSTEWHLVTKEYVGPMYVHIKAEFKT